MTPNEQKHAIDDLRRELAHVEEKIVALKYRASQEGEMFNLIGATLRGRNPEFVISENQSPEVTIAPIGRVVSISSKLIPTTEEITGELREAIKKRDNLKARLEPSN